jgi:ABC-2 type transport system permease protein
VSAVAARQLLWEQRMFWRNRGAAVFTFLLPVGLFLLVGALGRDRTVSGEPYLDWLIPGMLGTAIVFTAFAGLAISLTIRRESGILKRMRGTPLPAAVYLGALAGSLALVLLAEAVIILAGGSVAFGVDLPGRPDEMALLVVGGAVCFSALGAAASSFVASAEGSSATISMVYVPLLAISGAFYPLHDLPAGLRAVAEALPLAPLIEALHALVRDGSVGASDWAKLLVTVAWGVAGALVAARRFRFEPAGP